jgi:2-desacetyl-2-hydroxyethyl bacteriochlorophyllide A dehydrogenase
VRAVAKSAPAFGVQLIEVDPPSLQADEVLVRVEAAGICGSDVHIYEWTAGYEFLVPHLPVVLGHEFAGEVVAVGPGVQGRFRPGDRVTSETGRACKRCAYCKRGQAILCPHRTTYGRLGLERQGAMTAYVAAPEECLHRVPDSVSLEEAAMTEPAAVALGAVRLAGLDPGEPVVIIGPGPIGLLVLAMCRAVGAGPVVVVGQEADGKRLATARRMGATEALSGDGDTVARRVMELTDGLGAAVVFEASGAPAAAGAGLTLLRKGGEMILVGIYAEPLRIDATREVVRQMKSIRGSYGGSSLDFDRVLTLVAAKRVDLAPLISEILPLDEAARGFELLRRKDAFKILLRPER